MSGIPRGQTPERRAYMKRYRETHPSRDRRAYKAAYDASHQEQIANYRAVHRTKHVAQNAAWYQANRARLLAKSKSHAAANRARILAYQARYYTAHTDKVKANVSAYRKANPDKKRHLENRRRVRKVGNGGSHTVSERREKFAQLGDVCYYCGESKPLTVDHDVPLARGGTDNIDNILPSCRSCNSRKNTRTAAEYVGGGDIAGTR